MTATMPPRVDVRDCRLYRFYVEHPVTGEEVLGYIGETVRQPFARLMEHVHDQPWMDTATRWERDPRVFAGKQAVLEAEAAAIRDERPLYNVKENLGNEWRIIPPDAIRQRRARDAQHGAARWEHPDDREAATPRASSPRVLPVRRTGISHRWTPQRIKVCLWSTAWGATTGIISGELVRTTGWTTMTDLLVGGCSSTALLVWAVLRRPDTVKMWRRRWRKLRRWVG